MVLWPDTATKVDFSKNKTTETIKLETCNSHSVYQIVTCLGNTCDQNWKEQKDLPSNVHDFDFSSSVNKLNENIKNMMCIIHI